MNLIDIATDVKGPLKNNYNHLMVNDPKVTDQLSRSSQTISLAQKTLPLISKPGSTVSVIDLLDAVRENPEALYDPQIKFILDEALRDVWSNILREPTSYVMTRDEFAVFNFFQHLHLDEERALIARTARANYWNTIKGPLGK